MPSRATIHRRLSATHTDIQMMLYTKTEDDLVRYADDSSGTVKKLQRNTNANTPTSNL